MSVQSILKAAQALTPQERLQLINALLAQLVATEPTNVRQSMAAFRGKAAPSVRDAQDIIDQLRAEWPDERGG